MEFSLVDTKMELDTSSKPAKVRVHPEDLYPYMIARIKHVLETGETPVELLALPERGGSKLAQLLVENARALPANAWEDALRPRDEFTSASYFTFVDTRGNIKQDVLDMLKSSVKPEVERMIQRGQALEIALAWFVHALRLRYGACQREITTGKDKSRAFRL